MTAIPVPPASELDDDEVLAEHAADAGPHGSDEGPVPDVAWVSTADPRRWGHMEDGKFVEVPKPPLILAGLEPPCTVQLYGGPRLIIAEPEGVV
jgi:hypothetical protein